MDSSSWTHRPPSPPLISSTTRSSYSGPSIFPLSRPGPSRRASHNVSLIETTLSLSALSLPLGAPLARPTSHPAPLRTPSSSISESTSHPGAVTIPTVAGGVSPPTPAPSPTPRERWPIDDSVEHGDEEDELDGNDAMGLPLDGRWKGKIRADGEFAFDSRCQTQHFHDQGEDEQQGVSQPLTTSAWSQPVRIAMSTLPFRRSLL